VFESGDGGSSRQVDFTVQVGTISAGGAGSCPRRPFTSARGPVKTASGGVPYIL